MQLIYNTIDIYIVCWVAQWIIVLFSDVFLSVDFYPLLFSKLWFKKTIFCFRSCLPGRGLWTDLPHVLQEVQLITQIIIQVWLIACIQVTAHPSHFFIDISCLPIKVKTVSGIETWHGSRGLTYCAQSPGFPPQYCLKKRVTACQKQHGLFPLKHQFNKVFMCTHFVAIIV